MSDKLLEQYVRTQNAVHFFPAGCASSACASERGQTTVEWLVIMVGLIALAGVLAGRGCGHDVAKSLTDAFTDLLDKIAGSV